MRWIRSGMLVFGANIADSLIVLLRNIVLARLLSVQDFGIAATFSILLTLMDAAQTAGLNRMIVQAPDAEEKRMLDSVHGIQVVLGLVTAIVLLAAAWPYAAAMKTGSLVWAYALMAVVPAARAFCNLDSFRQQRQGRFLATIVRQLVPQFVSLAAIWPAYLLMGDYRTMLIVIMAQQVALLVVTNFFATQRFAIRFDPEISGRAFRFGWPLFVNGLLMFFVTNGDRMIVSNRFGLTTLGWFSLAFMLTMMPTTMIARSLQTLMLPSMAKAQADPVRLQRQNDQLASLVMLIMVAFVGAMALLGEPILVHIFGEKFRPAEPFLVLLAIMQGIRLVRAVPALTAMAVAETKNPLYTNLLRGAAIPVAFGVALATGDIYWMLVTGIVGEVVSALAAGWIAQRMIGIGTRHYAISLCAALQLSGVIAGISLLHWHMVLLVPSLAVFLFVTRDFWLHARDLLRR